MHGSRATTPLFRVQPRDGRPMGRTTVATRTFARILVIGVLATTTVGALTGTSYAESTHAAEENSFVAKINAHRFHAGLDRLTVNLQLTGVARAWSDRMAAAGSISHNPQVATQVDGDWTRL